MRPVIGCITIALGVAACAPESGREAPGANMAETGAQACEIVATPAALNPGADVQAALAHARQLRYLPGSPFGDRRPLTRVTTPGPRPDRRFGLSVDAEIQPEECSYLNDPSSMQGTNGRIVARIITSGPYQKLGLPRDTSYLWIQNLVINGDSGTAQALVIPANGGQPVPRTVRVEYHPEIPNRNWPEARLIFTAEDDELWESCVKFGCCYLEEGRPGGDTTAVRPGE